MRLAAYTATEPSSPPYISIHQVEEGVEIVVRSAPKKGVLFAEVGTIVLPLDDFKNLVGSAAEALKAAA